MSRIPINPTVNVRGRRDRRDIEALKKRGPGSWVYLGTWPTDPFTTPDSPAWLNGWAHAGTPFDRVAFRWDEHGRLEFKGHADSLASTAVLAFTLPDEYWPDKDVSWLTDVVTGATPTTAQVYIEAATGDVTVTVL